MQAKAPTLLPHLVGKSRDILFTAAGHPEGMAYVGLNSTAARKLIKCGLVTAFGSKCIQITDAGVAAYETLKALDKQQAAPPPSEPDICGARPYQGDGTLWCELAPLHKGLHESQGYTFYRIRPGTSPRSPQKVKRAIAVRRFLSGERRFFGDK